MKLRRLLAQDIEGGVLRMELMRGLTDLAQGYSTRKHELHVSDFTHGEKAFCIRRLIHRYYEGDERAKDPTLVEFDGKWREEKWMKLLEVRGMLVGYQPELKYGELVGHPDFLIKVKGFKGLRILELTGHDSQVPIAMQKRREAIKVRQDLMYQKMAVECGFEIDGIDVRGGYVLIENKGSNSFRIITVKLEQHEEKVADLFNRVNVVQNWIRKFNFTVTSSKQERLAWNRLMSKVPKCEKKKCDYCRPVKE